MTDAESHSGEDQNAEPGTPQQSDLDDKINRLFASDNPVLRLGRDLGMGVVNAIPGLRRGFIRQAAGLTGELPKLLTGRQV